MHTRRNTFQLTTILIQQFLQQSLTCEQSLIMYSLLPLLLSLHFPSVVQAGRLQPADCVQPCLLYPLSRYSQEISSEYQDDAPHTQKHYHTHTACTHICMSRHRCTAVNVSHWALVIWTVWSKESLWGVQRDSNQSRSIFSPKRCVSSFAFRSM